MEDPTIYMRTPRQKGIVTRQFTVWCGVCEEWEMQSANHIDQFLDSISSKNGNWRLTRDFGWTHKKCMRMMPTQLKLHERTTEEDPASDT